MINRITKKRCAAEDCGKSFAQKVYNQKFCSTRCKNRQVKREFDRRQKQGVPEQQASA